MMNLISRRLSVLDSGWIELVDMMPHPSLEISPDLAVVNAARVSFLGASKGQHQDKKLLFYLMRNQHTSPFEMVRFKFRVHAPVVVWWQWMRHRTASFNMQSGRYTAFEQNKFYIPNTWRLQSKDNKQASEGELTYSKGWKYTRKLRELTKETFDLYEQMLGDGIAREQARLVLPAFGLYYTGIVMQDAHNLMHFLKLRMASDAQYEIRQYAETIYTHIFTEAMPWTAEAFKLYQLNQNGDK